MKAEEGNIIETDTTFILMLVLAIKDFKVTIINIYLKRVHYGTNRFLKGYFKRELESIKKTNKNLKMKSLKLVI